MTPIPISIARQRALDRVTLVLQRKLGEEATALQDPAGLPLSVPDDGGYYMLGTTQDDGLANRNQAIFVYETSPREVLQKASGGPETYIATTRFSLNVLMVFKIAMHEPLTKDGKAMTREDVLKLRAERYTGAIINTMLKYACEADAIHDIDVIDDQALIQSPGDKKIIGTAVVQFRVTQKVTMPQRRPLPLNEFETELETEL